MKSLDVGGGQGLVDAGVIQDAFRRGEPLDVAGDRLRVLLDGSRPFMVVVRDADPGDPLTHLVQGEAGHLRAAADADPETVAGLVRRIVEEGVEAHGTFLLIELWAGDDYRVLGPDGPAPATVRTLARGIGELDVDPPPGEVEVVGTAERAPPGHAPLLDVSTLHTLGALLVGVELVESWRDRETGALYPVFLRRLAHDLSKVLRNAAFEFLRVQTGTRLSSYRALGRRTLGEAVWSADRRLAEIDGSFDPLLLVAPVNESEAWERFRDGGYQKAPRFHYRLLPVEPDLLKRELYEIPLERVEDPAAWKLLRDKREELDRQISLLSDRNSPEFMHSCIRLFGTVSPSLRERAEEILERVPPPTGKAAAERVGAREFADLARAEFEHYRSEYPDFRSEVQVRPDLVGLMVSSGRLLVGQGLSLSADRVEALLQHEVGTHVLTYVNGAAQPFLQLAHGFADYDELQEGLGVLAEYLVGGLTPARIRLLAARVIAVDSRLAGAGFVETFRHLHDGHGFTAGTSFGITARVHQGGGFTRDHIYLRGLTQVVEYLRDGRPLEPLYVGKIAARHVDVIRELQERGVLRPVPLLPRFLQRDDARKRLRAVQDGLPLHAMVSNGSGESG